MKTTEVAALDYVQDQSEYGSLEELAYHILEAAPNTLKGDINYRKISAALDLPEWVLRRVVRSMAFKNVIRIAAANLHWTVGDEISHVKIVAEKATDKEASIDTVTKAREHIGKLQGEPLDKTKGDTIVPIQIVLPTPTAPQLASPDDDVPLHHVPAQAGQLPPSGVRAELVENHARTVTVHGVDVGSELDFYSDEAKEQSQVKQEISGDIQ